MHVLRIAGLSALLSVVTAPVLAAPRVRVLADRVNLRARDSEAVEVVGQAAAGQELTALGPVTGEWVCVAVPEDVSLWIYGELVRDGRVVVDRAQVRGGPGLQFKRVAELPRGERVQARGQLGEWLKIAPPAGSSLWISRAYVEPLDLPPPPAPPLAPPPPPVVAGDDPALERLAVQDAPPVEAPAEVPAEAPPAPAPPGPRAGTGASAAFLADNWPGALASFAPDASRPQGVPARYDGRLVRTAHLTSWLPGDYQLVREDARGRPRPVCRVVGLEGQLAPLAGCRVQADGRVWYLAGSDPAVLEATRLVRLE